jgi:hypothetical protein
VAERVDSNARREVKVFAVLNIPHVASLALLEHRWRADIGRDHVRELLVYEASGLGVCMRVGSGERRIALWMVSIGWLFVTHTPEVIQ